MTNSFNDIQREFSYTGQKFETVTNFKYLVAIVSEESSEPGVLSRTAKPL